MGLQLWGRPVSHGAEVILSFAWIPTLPLALARRSLRLWPSQKVQKECLPMPVLQEKDLVREWVSLLRKAVSGGRPGTRLLSGLRRARRRIWEACSLRKSRDMRRRRLLVVLSL